MLHSTKPKFGARVTNKIVEATPYANEFSVDMQTQDNSEAPSEDNSDAPSCDEPRRSTRTHRPPVRFGIDNYSNSSVAAETSHRACYAQGIVEPKCYAEALTSPLSREWLAAAQAEYDSLVENNTWELFSLPSNRQTIDCKWVFRSKYDKD